MGQHIRKGDTVYVVTGKHAGQTAKVLRVSPKTSKVLLEGLNVVTKHQKPTQINPQGGVIRKEMPVHLSNVVPAVDGKPSRVRYKVEEGKKVRVAVKGGQAIAS